MFKLEEVLDVLVENVYQKLEGNYNLQGHISEDRNIDLENINRNDLVKTSYRPSGFWTSTVYKDVDEFISKWLKFDRGLSFSSFSRYDEPYFHVYTIKESPSIKHIGSTQEAEEFVKNYREGFVKEDEKVVWSRVAKDYDAVHVYDEGFNHDILMLWDVESTVWFTPKPYLKEQFVWKLGEKDE